VDYGIGKPKEFEGRRREAWKFFLKREREKRCIKLGQ